ncbi:MAG: hydrolase [Candidatus Zixiibacteriota bacterium]|nr:MAG: hydrolase [candidate division Zixibacteria bacterium]
MLEKDNAVLVVIDIQGKLATLMHHRGTLFQNAVRMIQGAGVLGIPIIWTEQLPDKLGETSPEIKAALKGEQPLVKKAFSCCGDDAFLKRIVAVGRKQVLLTGIETHICVYQTAVDLIRSGYEVYVVQDAVSSRIESNYDLGIERMKDAGAILTSVEMSLFEMLRVAEGDQFRQIVRIVK